LVGFFFFFFNRHCNPCGFWPAELSLSILSRKDFTECRCQRHVKPPTWRTSDLELPPRLKRRERTPAAEGGAMGEKLPRILPKVATSTSLLGSSTCRKFTTWDRLLYFPSEGRRVEDFFVRKIRRLRPDLNPRTWVPEASTLTSRPPKPLIGWVNDWKFSTTNNLQGIIIH